MSLQLLFFSHFFYLELLESNQTIWMLDHPFYHGLATDPREDVREMYKTGPVQFYPLSDQDKIDQYNQAQVLDSRRYYRQIALDVLKGKDPAHRLLDETISLMALGHHLRINDVLSDTVNSAQCLKMPIVYRRGIHPK